MKKIKIKGKDYIEVHERIKFFRDNFKGHALISEIISNEAGVCIFKASIVNPDGITIATGFAYEKEGSSFINKTSYIENCETSAWGRALGNLGIGIDTSIASAEEVGNAIQQQKVEKLNGEPEQNNTKPESSDFTKAKDKALMMLDGIKGLATDEWKEDLKKIEIDLNKFKPDQIALLYHTGLKLKCISIHSQILWNSPELEGLREGMASNIRTLKYIDLKKLVKELEDLKNI